METTVSEARVPEDLSEKIAGLPKRDDPIWEEIKLEYDPNQAYPVEHIVTHKKPHLDEQFGMVMLAMEGEDKFPGVANAQVHFTGDPTLVKGDKYLRFKALPLGTGQGILDEHREDKKGKCATDLVVEVLGITCQAIHRIANWVRHGDKTQDVMAFELSSLIKEWFRIRDANHVIQRTKRILYDLIRFERGFRAEGGEVLSFDNLANEVELRMRMQGVKAHHKGVRRVTRYLREFGKRKPEDVRPLEIGNLFRNWGLLYPRSQRSMVHLWALEILQDAATVSVKFQDAFANYKPMLDYFRIRHTNREVSWVLEYTEDRNVLKYARIRGAEVSIFKQKKGTTQLFTSSRNIGGDYKPFLNIENIVAAVRVRELRKRGLGHVADSKPWEYWCKDGTVPECPWWHYLKAGEMLLNGSIDSAEDMEPTVLGEREIAAMMKWHLVLAADEAVAEAAAEKKLEATVAESAVADQAVEEDETEEESFVPKPPRATIH